MSMSDATNNGERRDAGQGDGFGHLLTNPDTIVQDCKTVRRAFVERWPIPRERRERLLTILQQIAETDEFTVEKVEHDGGPNGEGAKETKTASIRMPNHRNQIAAAKAILAAQAADDSDRQHLEKLEAGQDGAPVDSTIRILVVDARGHETPVGSLRELYANYPAPLPAPADPAAGPQQAQGRNGRTPRGQNGLGNR